MNKSRLNIARAYEERKGDFYNNEERAKSYNSDRYDRCFAICGYKEEGGYYYCYSDMGAGYSSRSPHEAQHNMVRDILDNNPDLNSAKHLFFREEWFKDWDRYDNGDVIHGYIHIFILKDRSND